MDDLEDDELLEEAHTAAGHLSFVKKMTEAYEEYGYLTDNQREKLIEIIDESWEGTL